ncbi:MAG: hypothetical protein ACK5LL_16240 [Suipraeoptans sp.]
MKAFIKFIIKLLAVVAIITSCAYLIKKFFLDEKEDEFSDSYTDLKYELDDDLKPVTERDYVSITPTSKAENTTPEKDISEETTQDVDDE